MMFGFSGWIARSRTDRPGIVIGIQLKLPARLLYNDGLDEGPHANISPGAELAIAMPANVVPAGMPVSLATHVAPPSSLLAMLPSGVPVDAGIPKRNVEDAGRRI